MDENIVTDDNRNKAAQHKGQKQEQATSNVSSIIEGADDTNNTIPSTNSKRTQVCDAEDDETAAKPGQAAEKAMVKGGGADAAEAVDDQNEREALEKVVARWKEELRDLESRGETMLQRDAQQQGQAGAHTGAHAQASQHKTTSTMSAASALASAGQGQASAWHSGGARKSFAVPAAMQPTPTTATAAAPVVAHSDHTEIHYHYYGGKMSDEDDAAAPRSGLGVKALHPVSARRAKPP